MYKELFVVVFLGLSVFVQKPVLAKEEAKKSKQSLLIQVQEAWKPVSTKWNKLTPQEFPGPLAEIAAGFADNLLVEPYRSLALEDTRYLLQKFLEDIQFCKKNQAKCSEQLEPYFAAAEGYYQIANGIGIKLLLPGLLGNDFTQEHYEKILPAALGLIKQSRERAQKGDLQPLEKIANQALAAFAKPKLLYQCKVATLNEPVDCLKHSGGTEQCVPVCFSRRTNQPWSTLMPKAPEGLLGILRSLLQ